MTLDEFLDKVCRRPLPQNGMARIRTLAKELAQGATEAIWKPIIVTMPQYLTIDGRHVVEYEITDNVLKHYIEKRWDNNYPKLQTMVSNGFLHQRKTSQFSIEPKAFDLIDETEPSAVFISYRRSASSAFALMVYHLLKCNDIATFLDKDLNIGADWQVELEENIRQAECLILLLSNKTLASENVVNEIMWALDAEVEIIPIWQPKFKFKREKWPTLSEAIKDKLANTHSIQIQDENPLEYDKAMTELLNRFGITP